ncbi:MULTISPECIES: hypothetical protein [unclassified Arenibacter]|uniref:hypothetical protein n=1 Tax=unclassified Arenibacter TaxID=2615047 RepID=UPI000E3446C8|nr:MULTISPECIES: hypothetical protein [unclassified Arenibacter]MCM4165893.1 hypothetical protein [Arenibacter sp. A80]RFT54509.1 hypothetical protein D0S24_20005 [Arenibacter sp. P308M17]
MPDRLGAVSSGYNKGIKKSVMKTDFFISAYRLPLTAYRLPLTAYRLPLTAYRLPLTAFSL